MPIHLLPTVHNSRFLRTGLLRDYSFPWWMPHGPGISSILESPLQHCLYRLSLHSDLQGPLAGDVMLPHSLASVAFWNLGTNFHDLLTLKYFMLTKPVSSGWCCQVLLPVWGVAWPPWTTAVSDSVGWFLWERGRALGSEQGTPPAALSFQTLWIFLSLRPQGIFFYFSSAKLGQSL